jgi:hypothetical protein
MLREEHLGRDFFEAAAMVVRKRPERGKQVATKSVANREFNHLALCAMQHGYYSLDTGAVTFLDEK